MMQRILILFTICAALFWLFCLFFLDCRDRRIRTGLIIPGFGRSRVPIESPENGDENENDPRLPLSSVVSEQGRRHRKPFELPEDIHSTLNARLLENTCKFPVIEPNEKELDPNLYTKKFGAIHCASEMPNLASLSFDATHTLTIHNELERHKQPKHPFQCSYRGLAGGLAPERYRLEWIGKNVTVPLNGQVQVEHDQFVVLCHNSTVVGKDKNGKPVVDGRVIYERAFAGFSNVHEEINNTTRQTPKKILKKKGEEEEEPLSLSILVLDSVSRNQALRHLPRTLEFMRRLGFVWLDGYTKVADNSAVNLLPVLAGRTFLDRVGGDGREILQSTGNNTIVDLESLEFLWDLYKKRGCVTSMNDDASDVEYGLFFYPIEHFDGFRKQPTDYFFRAFHLYNPMRMFNRSDGSLCMHYGRSRIDEYLDIWEKASTIFAKKCHFSFNFITELTHDTAANLGSIDDRLRTSLERMFANEVMENTALVIMGDHGNRIGTIQYTYTGRIEERTPFFSLFLPRKFRDRNPEALRNFIHNKYRLTSNFDVHRTLRDLAEWGLPAETKSRWPVRGFSLLTERVPANRSCEDAGVPPNFCTCLVPNAGIEPVEKNKASILDAISVVLKTRLQAVMPCALIDESFRIAQNSSDLQTLTINDNARLGVRHMIDLPQFAGKTAPMDIVFFDVFAMVSIRPENARESPKFLPCTKNGLFRVSILARFRHYRNAKPSEVSLPVDPLIFVPKRPDEDEKGCGAPLIEEASEGKSETLVNRDDLFDPAKYFTVPADQFCASTSAKQEELQTGRIHPDDYIQQ